MKVYLDNAASTKAYPDVAKTVYHMLTENYANPSALHTAGQDAEKILKISRRQIALSLGVKAENIVFTSGGTEANNLALFSAFYSSAAKKKTLFLSSIEHPAVKNAAIKLASQGIQVKEIPIFKIGSERPGGVDIKSFRSMLDENIGLISIMHVNNEIGTIQPISELSKIVKEYADNKGIKIPIHSDAVQSYGKIPVDANRGTFQGVDFISMSAHKFHGPKGVGALYAANPEKLHPMIFGGGQENGIRSGTENVPGIAGFSVAVKNSSEDLLANAKQANACRRRLLEGITAEIQHISINSPVDASVTGKPYNCSPFILNISFIGTRGEVILHDMEKDGVYVSTGAACSSNKSGGGGTSVLEKLGLKKGNEEGAIRFSFSHFNTVEEMDYAVEVLKKTVARFRRIGSLR